MKILVTTFILSSIFYSCSNNGANEKKISVVEFASPTSDSCAEPYLFTDKNGTVHLSWIEKKGKESWLKFSVLENEKWTQAATIASGNNWFVNWADYPMLVSDGENMMAHYLEKSDTAKFTYDVKLLYSADKGKSWSTPIALHNDKIKAEHGFVSMVDAGDKFFVSWLDGRNTATEGEGHDNHHGSMTIRGAYFSKSGVKESEWELDNRVCDCCQTIAAITSNGPVVIYRDRSEEEIRDMSIVRYVKGEWTAPKTLSPDYWKIAGCPVNGPRADAIGNNLAVVWFSMNDKKGKVKVAFSNDGGVTFKDPIQIDEGNSIGRVDIIMLDEHTSMVSWMEGSEIKAVKVYDDGTKESSFTIASSSESRLSGFPQMTKSGNKIFFAWTDDKERTIKLARLSL